MSIQGEDGLFALVSGMFAGLAGWLVRGYGTQREHAKRIEDHGRRLDSVEEKQLRLEETSGKSARLLGRIDERLKALADHTEEDRKASRTERESVNRFINDVRSRLAVPDRGRPAGSGRDES